MIAVKLGQSTQKGQKGKGQPWKKMQRQKDGCYIFTCFTMLTKAKDWSCQAVSKTFCHHFSILTKKYFSVKDGLCPAVQV